jgi:single-stranded DNA-binding protein
VKKGALVSIEGRLVVRSYTNKDGRNIRVTEVKVDNLRSLGSRNDDNTSSSNIDDLQINVPTQNDNTIES